MYSADELGVACPIFQKNHDCHQQFHGTDFLLTQTHFASSQKLFVYLQLDSVAAI